MKRFGIVTVLIILLAACSGSEPEASPAPEVPSSASTAPASPVGMQPDFSAPAIRPMTTIMDTRNGFEIDVPRNWEPVQLGQDGCPSTHCFYAPAQEGQVPAAIMVHVGTNQGENLQASWNTVRQLLISSWGVQPRTVPGTQGNTEMAGEPAKTATYTLDWGLIPAKMIQTMTLDADGTPFLVTGISAESIWDDVDPTFQESTASFTLEDA